jgi:DNA-binding response OmpR family regulator
VLLIDDNEPTLRMVSSVLQQSGFEVRTSLGLEQVASAVGEWSPELILTDVNMPGTSGVELCRRLKATYETAHVPVILFSALEPAELELLVRTCEADGFVTKSDLANLSSELSLVIDSLML